MKDNEIKALIGKTVNEKIQKFKNQMDKIFADKEKSLDEKLIEISKEVHDYLEEKRNEDSREAQIKHENNDPPLARNRVIIQAEIDAHKISFDSNFKHHTKKEWDEKLAKLEEELKNSPV